MLVAEKPRRPKEKRAVDKEEDIQAFGKSLKRGLLIDKLIVFALVTVATGLAIYMGLMIF